MWIRNAVVRDAAGLAATHVASWQVAYRGIVSDAHLDDLDVAWRTERWTRILQSGDSETFVAEEGGRVVGFVSVGPQRPVDAAPPSPGSGEVWSLYVHPDRRAAGLGRALMHAGLDRLREREFVEATLWVFAANTAAQRFYAAGGWREDGLTNGFEVAGVTIPEVRWRIAL